MPEPARTLRGLVPFEIAAILALGIVPLPVTIPVALPLFAVATASRWARGRDWSELTHDRGTAWIAAAAGLAALAAAVVVGSPLVAMLSGRGVEWAMFPMVRGDAAQGLAVAMFVAITAVASELALRGWVVERMLELSPGPAILPVLVGGLAEAIVTPGGVGARLGACVFGAGLGWIYVAAGRSVVAPLLARLTFALGAVALEALRVIG